MNTRGTRRFPALCILLAAALPALAAAEVYKTTDKDGNVVYTDQPPADGSAPIELRELSVVPAPEYETPAMRTTGVEEGEADLGALRRGYRDFKLVSPVSEQTIVGTGNVVSVEWTTRFELQPGMAVIVQVDGQPMPPSTASVISTQPLDRGEHQVSAELVDAQQRSIAKAGPVTVFVHQNSAQFNRPARAGGG